MHSGNQAGTQHAQPAANRAHQRRAGRAHRAARSRRLPERNQQVRDAKHGDARCLICLGCYRRIVQWIAGRSFRKPGKLERIGGWMPRRRDELAGMHWRAIFTALHRVERGMFGKNVQQRMLRTVAWRASNNSSMINTQVAGELFGGDSDGVRSVPAGLAAAGQRPINGPRQCTKLPAQLDKLAA